MAGPSPAKLVPCWFSSEMWFTVVFHVVLRSSTSPPQVPGQRELCYSPQESSGVSCGNVGFFFGRGASFLRRWSSGHLSGKYISRIYFVAYIHWGTRVPSLGVRVILGLVPESRVYVLQNTPMAFRVGCMRVDREGTAWNKFRLVSRRLVYSLDAAAVLSKPLQISRAAGAMFTVEVTCLIMYLIGVRIHIIRWCASSWRYAWKCGKLSE